VEIYFSLAHTKKNRIKKIVNLNNVGGYNFSFRASSFENEKKNNPQETEVSNFEIEYPKIDYASKKIPFEAINFNSLIQNVNIGNQHKSYSI